MTLNDVWRLISRNIKNIFNVRKNKKNESNLDKFPDILDGLPKSHKDIGVSHSWLKKSLPISFRGSVSMPTALSPSLGSTSFKSVSHSSSNPDQSNFHQSVSISGIDLTKNTQEKISEEAQRLREKLQKHDEESNDRANFVADPKNFFHRYYPYDKNFVSLYCRADEDPEFIKDAYGKFVNIYTPEVWTFLENYREGFNNKEFYAADMVRYQYMQSSSHQGFFGQLPSVIERKFIVNGITTEKLKNYESMSEAEVMRVFFEETPNGKSLKRIMDEFGLEPIKVVVERVKPNEKWLNVRIYTRPIFGISISQKEGRPTSQILTPQKESEPAPQILISQKESRPTSQILISQKESKSTSEVPTSKKTKARGVRH